MIYEIKSNDLLDIVTNHAETVANEAKPIGIGSNPEALISTSIIQCRQMCEEWNSNNQDITAYVTDVEAEFFFNFLPMWLADKRYHGRFKEYEA